jgi:hypothetical protein
MPSQTPGAIRARRLRAARKVNGGINPATKLPHTARYIDSLGAK